MICINPYHKLIYTLFRKFEYEQWKDQSNLEHSHLVSKKNSILSSQKLLYHLYYTILQHTYHPNSIFFPVYLNILFFIISLSLHFPLFLPLPLAPATKKKKKKKNRATTPPPCHPHISQHHPPNHPKSTPIAMPGPRIQPSFGTSFEWEKEMWDERKSEEGGALWERERVNER